MALAAVPALTGGATPKARAADRRKVARQTKKEAAVKKAPKKGALPFVPRAELDPELAHQDYQNEVQII